MTQPTKQEASAVICAGLFFLVHGDQAEAHIIPDTEVTRFYEGTRFARDSRDPESSMLQLIRSTFHVKDVLFALPLPTKEHLVDCLDYNGPAQDAVRSLAAQWILGPWTQRDDDKGAHDRLPEPPTPPPTPAGHAQPDTIKPQLTPVVDLNALLALARK